MSPDPKEFYYDPSPDVTQGSFEAVHAFFMANRHNAETLECPDLDAFVAASPGAIIRWLFKLLVLVFSKRGQLLIMQAIAGLTSTVGGFALGGSMPTVTPRLFLDRYSEVLPPLRSDSLFATVLLSHVTSVLPALGGGTPAPAPVHHGGPPSCPDPVGVDAASSARPAASLHFGGHGLHYSQHPQHVRSSPALCGGYVPFDYGGFFRPAPPSNFSYYHHGHGGPPAHHGGHPSVQLSPSVHGGRQAPPWDVPLYVYGNAPFPQGHGGYPRATTLVALSLAFAGLSHHPSLPQDDHHSSSGSDITMSFPGPGQGLPPPLLYHPRPPPAPSVPDAPPFSMAKVLKLDSIKDAKAYLDALGIIEFYICDPNFSPGLADGALVTTSFNFEASCLWEGQLCLAIKDGSCNFCLKIKVTFTMVADLRCWPLLMLTAVPIPTPTHSPPSFS
jgi:hypothetical protein